MNATPVPWLIRGPQQAGREATQFLLDLGGHTLRLAEIDCSGFPVRLCRADEWSWADDPTQAAWHAGQAASALRELVAQRHWPRRAYWVFARNALLQSAMATLPPLPQSKLRDAILRRLGGILPLSLDDLDVAFEAERTSEDGGWQIAAVVAARRLVCELVATVESAGLSVAGLSSADAAYGHLIGRLPSVPERCAILDIGAAYTSISVVRYHRQSNRWHPLVHRQLPWGTARLTEAYCRPVLAGSGTFRLTARAAQRLQHAVGIPSADEPLPIEQGVMGRHLLANTSDWACALAGHIGQAVRDAECQMGGGAERLYLMGGGGALRGLDVMLGEGLHIPVEVVEPRCVVRADASVLGPGGCAIAAHALARLPDAAGARKYNRTA
jgi:Tfp pilus assembly PilM family ATPase